MGMYTELILGCALSPDTPQEIIEAIEWLVNKDNDKLAIPDCIKDLCNSGSRINWMFYSGGSYYFGAHSGERRFDYDKIRKSYRLTARFNIKNYDNEIQKFLTWLKPYIDQGSGIRELYAIITYEEGLTELFFLRSEDEV